MRSIVSFIIISFLIGLAGFIWGIYEFQTSRGLKTAQTLAIIKSYISVRPAKAPVKKPVVAKKPPEQPVPEEAPSITPSEPAPISPTKVELRRPPKKPEVKPDVTLLIEDGNKYYDAGIVHLRNTFNNDETFARENELAIKEFKQALAKYLEAENIDPDNLWIRNRIREANGNIVTCRKQARRK